MDALHVACAELAEADIFLTTDDKLGKIYDKDPRKFKVRIANPLDWLEEVNIL